MTPEPPPQPGDDTPPHATTGRTNPHTATWQTSASEEQT